MNFGDALRAIREAGPVQRVGWAPGRHVGLHRATTADEQPYLFVRSQFGGRVPWIPTHAELLASDWQPAPLTKESGRPPAWPVQAGKQRFASDTLAGEAGGGASPSDLDKAAARVVMAFASRDGNDNLFEELLEPVQALDEALDRKGRN